MSTKLIPAYNKKITGDNAKRASEFMKQAVNLGGCFYEDTQTVVANNPQGMKGQGYGVAENPSMKPNNLTCLCPYGMTYQADSKNTNLNAIIGNNCVDQKPPGNCNRYIMGRCLDDNPIASANVLKDVYFTWFWFPNFDQEQQLLNYFKFMLSNLNKMRTLKPLSIPASGLCVPMSSFPNKNNLTFITKYPGWEKNNQTGNEANRKIFGKWMAKNVLENPNKGDIKMGILAYVSYQDGPMQNFFYTDVVQGKNKNIKNPIDGSPLQADVKDPNPNKPIVNCKFTWGCFFDFMMRYVAPNCTGGKLPKGFWIHLDKESSGSNDKSFSVQDYTKYAAKLLGPLIDGWKEGDNIMFLAAALAEGCKYANKDSATGCWEKTPAVIVPEYYWGVGNQFPCDGGPSTYNYAVTGCTSFTPHRRLADYPNQYLNAIRGDKNFAGSDLNNSGKSSNGWLGNNGWAAAVKNLPDPQNRVWPSFSIENLSICDKNDTDCYSEYEESKKAGKQPQGSGIEYSKEFGKNTTICNSMLWNSITGQGKGKDLTVQQGTRQCGVFDGFSYWSIAGLANFLHTFANDYKTPGLIVYEASFMPYHWFEDLGTVDELKEYLGGSIQSSLISEPMDKGDPKFCPFTVVKGMGCKGSQEKPHDANSFCDPDCKIPCNNNDVKTSCKLTNQCGAGSDFKPGSPGKGGAQPAPRGSPGKGGGGGGGASPGKKSSKLGWILLFVGIVLLLMAAVFAFYHFRKK